MFSTKLETEMTFWSICNLKRSITSRFHKVFIIPCSNVQDFKFDWINQLLASSYSWIPSIKWIPLGFLQSKGPWCDGRPYLDDHPYPCDKIYSWECEVGAKIEMLKKWKRVKNGIRGRQRLLETEYILIKSGFQWRL